MSAYGRLLSTRLALNRTMCSPKERCVTFIPGDGVGPEISNSVMRIFEAFKVPIKFDVRPIYIPTEPGKKIDLDAAVESLKRNKIGIKGPLGTPIGKGHVSLNLQLRKLFGLYANLRPCKSIPCIRTHYKNVDLITIRENTEGEYSGLEHVVVDGVIQSIKLITREASLRVAKFAFEHAKNNGRKKVSAIHKANIMKLSDGLFLDCCREVSALYPDIIFEMVNLDRACYELTRNPSYYDVLVLPNLYGDIISDLASGLVGGLGLTPSGNVGSDGFALFEAVHGTAPDIVGKDLANPTALLFSSLMMLRHMGLEDYAKRIRFAVEDVLNNNIRTQDLHGDATCSQYTDEIIARASI